jgi:hypothetical protein
MYLIHYILYPYMSYTIQKASIYQDNARRLNVLLKRATNDNNSIEIICDYIIDEVESAIKNYDFKTKLESNQHDAESTLTIPQRHVKRFFHCNKAEFLYRMLKHITRDTNRIHIICLFIEGAIKIELYKHENEMIKRRSQKIQYQMEWTKHKIIQTRLVNEKIQYQIEWTRQQIEQRKNSINVRNRIIEI